MVHREPAKCILRPTMGLSSLIPSGIGSRRSAISLNEEGRVEDEWWKYKPGGLQGEVWTRREWLSNDENKMSR